jgi:hypothetical protein
MMIMVMVMDYMRIGDVAMNAYSLQSNQPYHHPPAYLYPSLSMSLSISLSLDGSLQMMSLGDPNLVLNYCRYGVVLNYCRYVAATDR